MNNVIQFKKRKDESDGDCDDPIDIIFTNLLFDLREHGYWEPSENDVVNENMCLMFESIESYMCSIDGQDHPLQELAKRIDYDEIIL
jgi:hypothetical protein